jgi:hypothetical protein
MVENPENRLTLSQCGQIQEQKSDEESSAISTCTSIAATVLITAPHSLQVSNACITIHLREYEAAAFGVAAIGMRHNPFRVFTDGIIHAPILTAQAACEHANNHIVCKVSSTNRAPPLLRSLLRMSRKSKIRLTILSLPLGAANRLARPAPCGDPCVSCTMCGLNLTPPAYRSEEFFKFFLSLGTLSTAPPLRIGVPAMDCGIPTLFF